MGARRETVTVRVRSPDQTHGDQTLVVELGWTVQRLKAFLRHRHPSRPVETEQKLIYSGRLLPDHLLLRDILRQGTNLQSQIPPSGTVDHSSSGAHSDQYHTIHLVCNMRDDTKSTQTASVKQPATPTASGQDSLTVLTPAAADGLRHRGPSAFPWTYGAWPAREELQSPVGMSSLAAYNLYSSQQIVWFQQMYARQYYMQYQAAVAAAAATNSQHQPVVTPGAPAALPNQPLLVNLPADQNVPLPQLNNPPANQNLRMNAQGGPVMDDDDDLNRDWLDWLYLAARASLFLSIVYFYSSLSRVVLVASAILLMYLHHAGWFPFRHPAPVQPVPNDNVPLQEANPNPGNEEHQQNQDIVQEENVTPDQDHEQVNNTGSDDIRNTSLTPEAEVNRTTFMNKTWLFFKTFFASLIPEGPRVVAN